MTFPYGITTFCDDFRTEDNGKHLIIGVYDDTMLLPKFPITVPQFAFVIKLLEPLSMKGEGGSLKIFVPGETGVETIFDVEIESSRWEQVEKDDFDKEASYLGSNYVIKVAPFRLHGPGYIRVRAYFGEDEVKLGSLKVSLRDILAHEPTD